MELTDNDRKRIEQQNPFLHSIYHSAWQRGAEYATIYEREKQAIKWIDVKEQLPEDNFQVLCCNELGRIFQTSYSSGSDQDEAWFTRRFTHWALLPETPYSLKTK